jgi:hypothetical protein
MVLILIVGWAIVLPAVVVGGLLLASSILGGRARRTGAIDATGFAREIARLSDPAAEERVATSETRLPIPEARPANAPRPEPRPAGAPY